MEFKDKIALVTGSSTGVGRAVAIELAAQGADIVLAARNEQRLEEVKKEVEATGRKAVAITYDQSSTESVFAMKDRALKAFGRVDVLVNNAAVGIKGRLEATSMEDWDWIVQTNLMGYVRCTQAFLPQFLERGNGYIVYVSSIQALAYTGEGMNVPYITTKAGIDGLAESVYAYVHSKGIKVSCLIPGGINTDMGKHSRFVGTDEEKARIRAQDEAMFETPHFLKPPALARALLEGMKKKDFYIVEPAMMKDMLRSQGRDIDAFNKFMKNPPPPPGAPRGK